MCWSGLSRADGNTGVNGRRMTLKCGVPIRRTVDEAVTLESGKIAVDLRGTGGDGDA
jgi:hypothetical protein